MTMGKNKLQKQGLIHNLRILLQKIIGMAIFFLSAGTLQIFRGWVLFGINIVITVAGLLVISLLAPDTVNERAKKRDNTKSWDKLILLLYILLSFYGIYIVAGLDVRFGWSRLSIEWMIPGIVLVILSAVFGVWSMIENQHFEATSRIQEDRSQRVCATGPYRFVRHPGYLSVILGVVAIPFVLGSLYAEIISLCVVVLIMIRTYLEDSMLKEELEGYLEYSQKVSCRLLPFIW